MQKIGERLEEARKRKGISLREAAEGTKIRSDFLSNIEQNKFDFELPEIYKRGFIKNYARYLKLDPEKIITDYSAQLLGNTRSKKGGNEWFGSMEIKPNEQNASTQTDEGPSYGRISAKPTSTGNEPESNTEESDEGDKMFYLKAGLIFLGTIALVFVIFGLVRAILGSSDTDTVDAEQAGTTSIEAPATPATPTAPNFTGVGTNEFKLIASDTVFVAARKLKDRKMLYQGTLSAGEEVVLQKDGPVEIVFTVAENISVQFNGETIRPNAANATGSSKIKLP